MTAPGGLYASLGSLLDEALRDGTASGVHTGSVPPPRDSTGGAQAQRDDASTVDPLQEAEDAATAVFAASCAVSFCYFAARGLFTLGLLGGLGWAFLTNPARDPAMRTACWEPLLAARQVLHGQELNNKLHRGKLFSALKSAVMGTTSLLRGKRVLVDLLFVCIAFVESSSKLDQDLCAVGVFGAWYIVQSRVLRSFAANHAVGAPQAPPPSR